MSTTRMDTRPDVERLQGRAGYIVAVLVNVAMLVVVLNILEWGWLPFLTGDFAEVIPWIGFSLTLTILVNLIYQFDDDPVIKSTGQILVNLASIVATYRIWQVFPFDFSGYQFNWELMTRVVLVLAMVGSGIGVLTEVLKLASRGTERR